MNLFLLARRWHRRCEGPRPVHFALVSLAVALFGLGSPSLTLASGDTTPPIVSALIISPNTIDVSSAPAAVTVTATITDDVSGVLAAHIYLESASERQNTFLHGGWLTSIGGDQFQTTVTIPQYGESGPWHVGRIDLYDKAGNGAAVYRSDLQALGIDPTVTVTGIADTSPPSLLSLSISPESVDVTSADATATVTATIRDDLSGVQSVWLSLHSPSWQQTDNAYFVSVGEDQYQATVTFPQGVEPGPWHVSYVGLVDNLNNVGFIFEEDLHELGLDRTVAVHGPDVTPPVLTVPGDLLWIDATSPSGATVTFTVSATDNLDPQPNVTCTAASGSVFPIGTTTVQCTAADTANNTTTAQFTVHVQGATEQLDRLRGQVNGVGPGTSLADKISDAQHAVARNDLATAASILDAFISEVTAQTDKTIPQRLATALIAEATNVKAVLGTK